MVTESQAMRHGFDSVLDKHGRGYLGRFWFPRGNKMITRFVRDQSTGAIRIFDAADPAERAASVAIMHALDDERGDKPSLKEQVFRTFGQGRNRKAIAVPARRPA